MAQPLSSVDEQSGQAKPMRLVVLLQRAAYAASDCQPVCGFGAETPQALVVPPAQKEVVTLKVAP
eukprot:15337077-Ditylum_brightwellii.AAC.2